MNCQILTLDGTDLIRKYNVPGPRYTSYPTVPYWDTPPTAATWAEHVRRTYARTRDRGVSLYIHLPYCESLCTYCGCNTRITVNHGVEEPYVTALLQEWALYREVLGEDPLIREIHLGGGTPTFFRAEQLQRLIAGLLKGGQLADGADLGFEAHPANTTDAHLRTLHALGFRRLSLGVQDFDPEVQRLINRRQSYEQVERVVQHARAIGYTSVNFDLIYGLPKQTCTTVRRTIERTLALRPERIAFYSYAHVPWLKPAQRSFEHHLPTGGAKRRLYETGKALLEAGGYGEIGMDHFALEDDALRRAQRAGGLHRNFMGYTTTATELMIGLGASSIGDAWTAFAQNHKAVEPYLASVRAGELPIARGHVLTDEDLTLRRHILNLMCRAETRWNTADDAVLQPAASRLREMEDDGLVTLGERSIQLTERGKPFVRNACMALDARLWRKRPETALFSQTV
ncbi:MAG: oxygen-independent coproporphyrinogen III oxidase [Catalinimonas sp.]